MYKQGENYTNISKCVVSTPEEPLANPPFDFTCSIGLHNKISINRGSQLHKTIQFQVIAKIIDTFHSHQ